MRPLRRENVCRQLSNLMWCIVKLTGIRDAFSRWSILFIFPGNTYFNTMLFLLWYRIITVMLLFQYFHIFFLAILHKKAARNCFFFTVDTLPNGGTSAQILGFLIWKNMDPKCYHKKMWRSDYETRRYIDIWRNSSPCTSDWFILSSFFLCKILIM